MPAGHRLAYLTETRTIPKGLRNSHIMESRRCGKKRLRETDCSGRNAAILKRRKSTRKDISIQKCHKNVTAKHSSLELSTSASTSTEERSRNTSNYSSHVVDDKSSCNDMKLHCLANRVRKTYSSSRNRKHVKKDRSRFRGNTRSKSPSKNVETANDKESLALEGVIHTDEDNSDAASPMVEESEVTHRFVSDNSRDEACNNKHLSTSAVLAKLTGESDVQLLRHKSPDKWKGIGNDLNSNESAKMLQDGTCSSQQSRPCSSVGTSIVFSPIPVPSQPRFVMACPMTPILCHSSNSGVPLMPVQSLRANTPSISSAPTQVVTLPLLPNGPQDGSQNFRRSSGFQNSRLQTVNRSDSHVIENVNTEASDDDSLSDCVTQDQISSGSCNSMEIESSSVSNTVILDTYPNDEEDPECLVIKDPEIPVIRIDDSCDTFLIEKASGPHTPDGLISNSLSKDRAFDSLASSQSGELNSSSDVSTLKVENWANYVLHRLKLLFDREEDCDLNLKFSDGKYLKVHRNIICACTSILSQPQQPEEDSEVTLGPEFDYTSVEHVVRFVYSGYLDVGGSKNRLTSIHAASQKLRVPLLTQLLENRFPHLIATKHNTRKLSNKKKKHLRQSRGKGISETFIPARVDGSIPDNCTPTKIRDQSSVCSNEKEPCIIDDDESEGGGEQDGSVYFLVTNSQKIAQANAAVRRKRPAEMARPTRFELEEVDPNSTPISTWSSKSTIPPYYSSSSGDVHENSISVSTVVSDSTICVTSNKTTKNTNVTWSNNAVPPKAQSDLVKSSGNETASTQFSDSFSMLSQNGAENACVPTNNEKLGNSLAVSSSGSAADCSAKDDEEDAANESEELMEKISSICRQLEDGDSDDDSECGDQGTPENCEYNENSINCEMASTSCQSSAMEVDSCENVDKNNDCIVLGSSSSPTKSILKTRKNKPTKKRVSFPLDENDELINEVATYSNSKEPSQSLLDVQKKVGSIRSSEDSSHTPMKWTLSLKKKVLRNLAEAVIGESQSSHRNVKGKSKKANGTSGQSTSQGISQGDMSNHAKIISEVLKKYPHLVKDRKNIRLKILKKGSDIGSSGKLVKSKVQYLVLSENDQKAKSSTKNDRNPSGGSKSEISKPRVPIQNTQRFDCPECEGTFTSYFTLKKHVTTEHKDKSNSILASIENVPYACYTCFLDEPLEFTDYCSYQQHMKEVHSKREARLCSICGYRPGRKLELAYHQYIEHNKLPRNVTFPKCDLCDHVAMTDAALLKHRSQHANSDNYTCSVCGVAFRSFGALQGHMQTKLCQNKPSVSHKCPYCPQTFARSYNLKAHCKSNHRGAHIAAQAAYSSLGEIKHKETSSTFASTSMNSDESLSEGGNSSNLTMEQVCGSLTNLGSNSSSSEAEALTTVANSLAASLIMPEDTVNHYMYTQGTKIDFTGELDGDKYNETVGRSSDISSHLIESTASVPAYSGNLPLCHDGTYANQSSISTTTAVGTFYPVGVVPGQIVPSQIVSGEMLPVSGQIVPSQIVSGEMLPVSGQIVPSQIVSGEMLPSQILPGTCVNVAGSAMLGPAPHSWTYVTYQIPTSGEDCPTVLADASNSSLTPDQNTCGEVSEIPVSAESENENMNGGGTTQDNSCEPSSSLVAMSNTPTQSCDNFSSQFV